MDEGQVAVLGRMNTHALIRFLDIQLESPRELCGQACDRLRHPREADLFGAHGMGVSDNLELNDISLERAYAFTKSVVEPKADTVFISCTGLRTIGAIEALEADLGRPVISAIQATFWDALCIAKVRDVQPGFGSLFNHWV